jgi:glucose-1-phosphate adenylyltransferase
MHIRVLGIVLAGGKGTRLSHLTQERAKPAVPFGGKYRVVDFVLSNFINSGINSIYVITQFRSQSLLQHLSEGGSSAGCSTRSS